MTILIRNARTLSHPKPVTILIEGKQISKVATELSTGADVELDAAGALILPTFVEPQIHLDKVLLSEESGYSSSMAEAREIIKKAKEAFTPARVKERIEKIIALAIKHGVTIMRTHVDIDPTVELKSLYALNEIRRKFSGSVDLQIAAHPQEGIVNQQGTPSW